MSASGFVNSSGRSDFVRISPIKYFLGTIEHLVCRTMYIKIFENRLTSIKVLVKNILNRYFLYKTKK